MYEYTSFSGFEEYEFSLQRHVSALRQNTTGTPCLKIINRLVLVLSVPSISSSQVSLFRLPSALLFENPALISTTCLAQENQKASCKL
jgi:hypothetical protein